MRTLLRSSLILLLVWLLPITGGAQTFAIPPTFDYAGPFSEGLAHVLIGRKRAFIDKTGKVVIDASRFDSVYPFSEGYARVVLDGKWGYIDRQGDLAIDLRFRDASDFKEGFATVSFDPQSIGNLVLGKSNKGLINKAGRVVVNPYLNSIFPFSDGYAVVNFGALGDPTVGVMNRDGRITVPARYEFITRFSGGLAAALTSKNGWGIIRPDGSWHIAPRFDFLSDFSEGLSVFADCAGRVHKPYDFRRNDNNCRLGYIDTEGVIKIPAQFVDASPFRESRAIVTFNRGDIKNTPLFATPKDAFFGFIDKSGALVVDPIYNEISDYSNGVARVRHPSVKEADGGWGFIDLWGKPVTPFKFLAAEKFSEGLASVQLPSGKWGYISLNR
jgi:hypothetical protein